MDGFVYSNAKPSRLGYDPVGNGITTDFILLDFYVLSDADVSRAVSAVRQRSFGSIPAENFYIATWTDARQTPGVPRFEPNQTPDWTSLFRTQEPRIINRGYMDDTGTPFIGSVV
jgi:hypothetical protein